MIVTLTKDDGTVIERARLSGLDDDATAMRVFEDFCEENCEIDLNGNVLWMLVK